MNLKKIIKEEIEDFTWMIDEPLNPWDEYDMIIFDIKPTKEEINNYIELALSTKNPENKESWEIGRKKDINTILTYFKNYGEAILNIDGYKNLVYGDPTDVNRNPSRYNSIKYSQLVGGTIKESEEEKDPFGWIRDTQPPSPHVPESGMKFKIKVDDSVTSDVIYNITDITDTHMIIKWIDPSDGVYTENFRWPLKHYFDFVDKGNVEIVYKNLNESEDDFDWARAIEPDLKVRVNDLREGLRVKVNTNKEDYGVFFHNDLRYYMEQSGGGEGTVKEWSLTDGNNTWVKVEWDNGKYNTYPLHEEYDIYSLLIVIDRPLTESEEDDWAWARGPIWVDDMNEGDRIRVYNKGEKDSFISWLGMYSDEYIAGDYGENIEGIVSGVAEDEFKLEVVSREGFEHSIYFPYKKDMEYIRTSNEDYSGLDLEYEFIPKSI